MEVSTTCRKVFARTLKGGILPDSGALKEASLFELMSLINPGDSNASGSHSSAPTSSGCPVGIVGKQMSKSATDIINDLKFRL